MTTEQIEKFDSSVKYAVEFIITESDEEVKVVLAERDFAILAEKISGKLLTTDKGVNILALFNTLQHKRLITAIGNGSDDLVSSSVKLTDEKPSVDDYMNMLAVINSSRKGK